MNSGINLQSDQSEFRDYDPRRLTKSIMVNVAVIEYAKPVKSGYRGDDSIGIVIILVYCALLGSYILCWSVYSRKLSKIQRTGFIRSQDYPQILVQHT